MRRKIQFLAIVFFLALPLAVLGQGTFQNLDFEAAQLIPVPGDPDGAVQFATAFPGWTGFIGGQPATTTRINGVPIGPPGQTPFIAIIAPPGAIAHQGAYELGFGSSINSPVEIAQTGLVPTQAKSLQFLALYTPAVTLGGQALLATRLGNGPGSTSVYGVDISAFAGQERELRFQTGLGVNYLDAITFSSQVIPEPSVFGLSDFGALLLGRRLRDKVKV